MKSILVSLSIICAFTWTVDAIPCQRCLKANSDTCVGESVNCPNATQCMVVSELYQFQNHTYHSIKKDCNPGFPCKGVYFSNFIDVNLRINIHCCSEDNCNTDSYKMPPENIEHSGKICSVCIGEGLTECISDNTERCLYPDDLCVNYIGKFKDPGNNIAEFSYKGCMSPLACKYKMNALVGLKEVENIHFTSDPGM
ncbi:phospholipase A2 inhibitor gamma subunit A2-like isoform X2 [Mixophyes fleayi]|uniref:phospholipase A2 inhibitor gamma subunit A2-like isoform X2 n=1 Tax=Mixophyes fleayi TaxID=3061075 RepID=UPI003F4E3AED